MQDALLDALRERTDAELLYARSLVGCYGKLVEQACSSGTLLKVGRVWGTLWLSYVQVGVTLDCVT